MIIFLTGLKLLPLNQIYDYHPPSLKNLFQVLLSSILTVLVT